MCEIHLQNPSQFNANDFQIKYCSIDGTDKYTYGHTDKFVELKRATHKNPSAEFTKLAINFDIHILQVHNVVVNKLNSHG